MDAWRPITPLPHPSRPVGPSGPAPRVPQLARPSLRPPVIEPEFEELDADEVVLFEEARAPQRRAVTGTPTRAAVTTTRAAVTPTPAPVVVVAPTPAPVVAAQTCAASPRWVVAHAIVAQPAPAPRPVIAAAPRVQPAVPAVVTAPRPISSAAAASASRWTAQALRRPLWWRYTAMSAGISALVTTLAIMVASDPASASTPAPTAPEPIVIAYDPALVEPPAPVAAASTTEPRDEGRLLARRIALRGTRNVAAGQPRLARRAFEEALEHDPRCRNALAGLGRLDFDAKRYSSAVKHLTLALRIEPRDPELRRVLGEVHQALGHDRSAARHFRHADEHKD